jgi:hypothetical protein
MLKLHPADSSARGKRRQALIHGLLNRAVKATKMNEGLRDLLWGILLMDPAARWNVEEALRRAEELVASLSERVSTGANA